MNPLASRRSVVAFLATLPIGLSLLPRRASAAPALSGVVPQPHMKEALASLRAARMHLDKALPDKGGHRVKAIALVDDAIKETQEGIEYDNQH